MSLLFAMWRGGKKRRSAYISIDTQTLVENIATSTLIATLSVVNGSGTYDFNIEDDPSGFFDLDGDHFEQVVASASADFDYEDDTSHTVTFSADNGVDPPIFADITFTVTNDVTDDSSGLVPDPPVLQVISGEQDTTPGFYVYLPTNYLDYRDAAVDDELIIEYDTVPTSGSYTTYLTRTLTAPDIAGTTLNLTGLDVLTNGDKTFRARLERPVEGASLNSPDFPHTINTAWTPAALFAGGEKGFWFDFTDMANLYQTDDTSTPITTNGQTIGRVTDLSGLGNHFTQATAGARPTFRVADGFNCVEGGGSRALTHTTLDLDSSQFITACIGARNNHASTAGVYFEIGHATTSLSNPSIRFGKYFSTPANIRMDVVGSPQGKTRNYSFAETNDGGTGYEAHVMTGTFPFAGVSTHIDLRINGVSKVTSDVTGNASSANIGTSRVAHLMSQANLAQSGSATRMCHIVLVNRELTPVEMSSLEIYTATKNGATL
jgi:hypothetical protein